MNTRRSVSYLWLVASAHLLFWIAVYFVPFILSQSPDNYAEMFAPKVLLNHVLLLFVFYFNAYFLQTWWQKKAGTILYIISLLLLLALFVLLSVELQKPPEPALSGSLTEIRQGPPPGPNMFGPGNPGNPGSGYHPQKPESPQKPGPPPFVLMIVLVTTISVLFRLILDKIKAERELRERETETLKTELSFLRSQISPHFIFNALNSTLSLIYKKSDQAGDSLLKLSGLMRYMLYESDDEKTRIAREAEYINDYIELQTLRFGDTIKIIKQLDQNVETTTCEIEPMLLIPFIENAFKHGVGMIPEPEIRIFLRMQDSQLELQVENKYSDGKHELKDKSSGIGQGNVMRRLRLLYPDAHSLKIDRDNNWYKVSLKIDLKK